jgi:DNA primase
LRFAFLPAGEDPDSLIRAQGPGAMHAVLDRAIPLLEMIWRIETEDKSFETPERQAALLARLNERLRLIAAADVRRFYFDAVSTRLSEQLDLRCLVYGDELRASAASPKKFATRGGRARERFLPVSSAVRNSRLVPREPGRASQRSLREPLTEVSLARPPPPVAPKQRAADGMLSATAERYPTSCRLKEAEVLALLLEAPEIIERQQEILASLPFADRSLDSLRHELLNVAASGFRLETGRLEGHLVRAGFGTLVPRLRTRRAGRSVGSGSARRTGEGGEVDVGDIEARWVRAATQLREMAEFEPERWHALERFKSEANEESWRDWHRLFLSRMPSDE